MVRFAVVLVPVLFALFVYGVVSVLMTPPQNCRVLPKWGWLLVVLLIPVIGSVLWIGVGRQRTPTPPPGQRSVPQPRHERYGRAVASASNADDAFLQRVRERAEAQRRAERQARLKRQRDIEEAEARRKKPPENPGPAGE